MTEDRTARSGEDEPARAARRRLRGPVVLAHSLALAEGQIEVWRTAGRRPPRSAAYFVAENGESWCVSASWSALGRALKRGRPSLDDRELMGALIKAGPGRRLVATREVYVPAAYLGTKWQPGRGPDVCSAPSA